MMHVQRHAFILAMILLSCLWRVSSAEAPAYVPGSCDAEANRLLKHATSSLVLGKTSIRTLAPQYWVDTASATNWRDALSQVDRLYGTNNQKRALFLWKLIRPNMPASALNELRLKRQSLSFGTGSGHSATYVLEPGDMASLFGPMLLGTNTLVHHDLLMEPTPKATLEFWISHSNTIVVSAPSLMLRDFFLGSVLYDYVQFNAEDLLTDFKGRIRMTNLGVSIEFGGNMTGMGGSNYFTARVCRDRLPNQLETLEFNPDLTTKHRRVSDPVEYRPMYRDDYEHGKRVRRGYYGEKRNEHGVSYNFVYFEEFESSASKPDTRR
jgi:hypothetical protein